MSTAGGGRRLARLAQAVVGLWALEVKNMTRSLFFNTTGVIQPIIFATIAFYMFRAGGHQQALLYVGIGAGLMGIWTETLFGSGGAVGRQRHQGTLEVLVAAPTPLLCPLLSIALATSTMGLYSLVATLVWGRLLFGMPLSFVHAAWFTAAVPATVLALGALGLLLASTFVLYRHADALSNMLEYPVWLVSGLLVPVSLLPVWTRPLAWALAPTWGVRALRDAALGGSPGPDVAACAGLAAAYVILAHFALRGVERMARQRATLELA